MKKRLIDITVEVTEGDKNTVTKTVQIQRRLERDGSVCFDGKWAYPSVRHPEGTYFLRVDMPAPRTTKQRAINTRCLTQLLAMQVLAGLGH